MFCHRFEPESILIIKQKLKQYHANTDVTKCSKNYLNLIRKTNLELLEKFCGTLSNPTFWATYLKDTFACKSFKLISMTRYEGEMCEWKKKSMEHRCILSSGMSWNWTSREVEINLKFYLDSPLHVPQFLIWSLTYRIRDISWI